MAQGYLKEDGGHRMEGLLWPGLKPVYYSVVDQAREVAAACAQGLAHRGHCQNHMQVVAALQHKLCPAGVLAVICSLLDSLHNTSSNSVFTSCLPNTQLFLFRVIKCCLHTEGLASIEVVDIGDH